MIQLSAQISPKEVDLEKYSGKWYVIAAIPTFFDKDWKSITETYTLKDNGKIDIYTTYIKEGETEVKTLTSKGFPYTESKGTDWEVQFVWPFRSDYIVEELGPEYSYAVVGHPEKLYLYIMTRTGTIDETLYSEIVMRYMKKGYEINDLKVVIR